MFVKDQSVRQTKLKTNKLVDSLIPTDKSVLLQKVPSISMTDII